MGPWQLTPPDRLSGKKEDFEEFASKLKAHVMLQCPIYATVVKNIELHAEHAITSDHFVLDGVLQIDLKRRSDVLQRMLAHLCARTASPVPRRDTDSPIGYESWRNLYNKCNATSRYRTAGRLTRNLTPNLQDGAFED